MFGFLFIALITVVFCTESVHAAVVYSSAPKKVVLIGCSQGIGREVARVLVKNRYKVGGISRNKEKLESLKEELGDLFIYDIADVQNDESTDVVKKMIEALGGCDIFIMNAGIFNDILMDGDLLYSEFLNLDWADLLQRQLGVIETNCKGFTRMGQLAIEYFMTNKKGHFVGITSVDAVRGNPWGPIYSATKAFQATYLQAWRSVFGILNIPVTITDIRPGFINTDGQLDDRDDVFWVESLDITGQDIFKAIQEKKSVAYITKRWESFAKYLTTVPDDIYNFLAGNFGIK